MSTDTPQSILAHLDELRWRIVRVGIAVLVGSVVAFVFADQIREIIDRPFNQAAPGSDFQTLAAGEQWGVLMRIALFGGVFLASPVILYQVWAFISPALTAVERKWVIPIVSSLVVLFVGGIVFGYWALPRGLQFLLGIFPDVETNLQLGQYYSFALRFLLAFGLAFLYPVFLYAAAAARILSAEKLSAGRRWAIVLIVIGAAAITPTGDALTLFVLSVPLYLMYEGTYWLVRLTIKP